MIPLTWEIRVEGAEEVKQKLQDVTGQFERGEITTHQYAQGLREVTRDANALNNSARVTGAVFLSLHPVFNDVSRAMSVFGSVARSVSSALSLITLAQLAIQGSTSNIAQAQADYNQALRDANNALVKYGKDSPQYIKATDDVKVALTKLKDATTQSQNAQTTMWISLGTGIVTTAATVIAQVPKIIATFEKFGPALTKITTALNLLPAAFGKAGMLAGTALDVGIAAGIVVGGVLIANAILEKLSPQYAKMMKDLRDGMIKSWGVDSFTAAILAPFVNAAIGFAIIGNRLVVFFVGILNNFVDAANTAIQGINNALGLHIPSIPKIPMPKLLSPDEIAKSFGINIPQVGGNNPSPPDKSSSTSSDTNPWQTSSSVITPSKKSGTSSTNITNNFMISGSIVSENDLNATVDKALKNSLIARGYS